MKLKKSLNSTLKSHLNKKIKAGENVLTLF